MRAEGLEPAPALTRQIQALVVVYFEGLASLPVTTQVIADDGEQSRLERFVRCRDGVHVFHVLPETQEADFLERLLLGIEVVIETALLDAELLGDVAGRRAVIALLCKHAGGRAYRSLLLGPVVAGAVGILRFHPGQLGVRCSIL